MDLRRLLSLVLLVGTPCAGLVAQEQAAMDKLLLRYTPEQVEEMRMRAHYKYEGLLLFYSSSFLVKEDAVFRTATGSEIAAVGLDQYNATRDELVDVVVHDATLDTDILLRSRVHFEELVMGHLNAHDRAAYAAYESGAQGANAKGQH